MAEETARSVKFIPSKREDRSDFKKKNQRPGVVVREFVILIQQKLGG